MKKLIFFLGMVILIFVFISCEKDFVEEPATGLKSAKTDKNIGFDQWGYNWNAQTFNGYLVNMVLGSNYFRDVFPLPHYQQELYNGIGGEVFWNMLLEKYFIMMSDGSGGEFEWHYFPFLMPGVLIDCKVHSHWNDDLIDKGGNYPPMKPDGTVWVNSNAWIVFKYTGVKNGEKWVHKRKLIAIQSSYELVDGKWYDEYGIEIGLFSKYWSADLIVIQSINVGDIDTDIFYEEYISPSGSGMGSFKNE